MKKKEVIFDVVVCGSATVDVFANTESELIEIKTNHSTESLIAYPSGSKILIKELLFEIGGGGTNTSVGFSRMGLKTGYIGCLGEGENGLRVQNLLQKEKITFLGHTTAHQTGYSVILDSIAHDRTILTFKGANDFLDYKKIKNNAFDTKWFYFSSMMNGSLESQKKLAIYAKKKNIGIAYNPSEYQVKQGYEFIKPILDATTILVLNKEEASYLAGYGETKDLLRRLYEFGPSIVCITDGSRCISVFDGKMQYIAKPMKIKVVETTGAGDAFASGFVATYIKGKSIHDALKIGIANAQSVITKYGAKNELLSCRKAKKYVDSFEIKITKKQM